MTVNYTTLRDNMNDCFDSLMETLYLLGNKANYNHLMKSVAQYRAGQTSSHDITED